MRLFSNKSCFVFAFSIACRRADTQYVTVALPEAFTTFDTLTTTASDSAAERVRNLVFNTLVRKNESFEYVGELAKDIKISDDGKTVTFTLQDNVKFHNGKEFTSADVKYTFDEMFKANGYKAGAFFDTETIKTGTTPSGCGQQQFVGCSCRAKDKTRSSHCFIRNTGSENRRDHGFPARTGQSAFIQSRRDTDHCRRNRRSAKGQPIGTGPFKFVNFDPSQNTVELAANADYWEGAPKFQKLRVKTVTGCQLPAGRAPNRRCGSCAESEQSSARHAQIARKQPKSEGRAVRRVEHPICSLQYAVAAAQQRKG